MRWRRQQRRRRLALAGLGLLVIVGLRIQERPPVSRPNQTLPSPLPPTPAPVEFGPPGIVLHDSDSPGFVQHKHAGAAHLEEVHASMHPGWATTYQGKTYHIGYHYIIRTDGVVEEGRPVGCPGTHARTHNDWIGVCMIGAFSTHRHWYPERPTKQQMAALTKLCETLMSKYHIPPKYVKRHRDINDTFCPGDRFPYARLMASLDAYAAKHPETQPPPGRVVSLAKPPVIHHKRKDEG